MNDILTTTKPQPSILVIDDEVRALESVKRILSAHFDVHLAESVEAAREIMAQEWIQVLLCDQRMPGMSGIEFCEEVRHDYPEIVRMIISGYTDSDDLINAINRGGIYQFIPKPWQPDDLIVKVDRAIQLFDLQRENQQLSLELKLRPESLEQALIEKRRALKAHYDWNNAIIRSPESPMNEICGLIRQVAPYDVNVILSGESGTGKELLARALHYNSLRQDKPFVAENCGALPDQFLESELFGHKRGAFVGANSDHAGLFERANGGTVFLDGVADTSPAFQLKLLRVLQEGEVRPLGSQKSRPVDVRVIASTSRNLLAEAQQGTFRQDLYFRLATFLVDIPPLRQRKMDIRPLAVSILNDSIDQLGKRVKGIAEEAFECFEAYNWPGNVRELQNEIKRMLVLADDDYLGSNLVSPHILLSAPEDTFDSDVFADPLAEDATLKERVESLERRILKETLMRLRWNKSAAAQELGLSRVGLHGKLDRYGLEKNTQLHDSDEKGSAKAR